MSSSSEGSESRGENVAGTPPARRQGSPPGRASERLQQLDQGALVVERRLRLPSGIGPSIRLCVFASTSSGWRLAAFCSRSGRYASGTLIVDVFVVFQISVPRSWIQSIFSIPSWNACMRAATLTSSGVSFIGSAPTVLLCRNGALDQRLISDGGR